MQQGHDLLVIPDHVALAVDPRWYWRHRGVEWIGIGTMGGLEGELEWADSSHGDTPRFEMACAASYWPKPKAWVFWAVGSGPFNVVDTCRDLADRSGNSAGCGVASGGASIPVGLGNAALAAIIAS